MKFWSRIKNWWWFSLYEAARKYGFRERSYQQSPEPRDAHIDITNETRIEILRRARGFEANDSIVNRMVDVYEQYVVGANGLPIIPDTSSDEFNTLAFDYWQQSSGMLDLCSRLSTASLMTIGARREFIDGEIVILKTRGEEKLLNGEMLSRPRIQMIESHRIGTPPNLSDKEGRSIIDGWEVDLRGRPIAIHFQDLNFDTGEYVWRRRLASDVIMIGEPSRIGQLHALSYLHPVMNDLQDLAELQSFAKAKAKDASLITRILKNSAGEFKSLGKSIRESVTVSNTNSAGEAVDETRTKFIQKVFGPRAVALRKDEEYAEFNNGTPTAADEKLWNILLSRACVGTGVSKLLVFPESFQGTVVRGEYEIANAFFRSRSAVHAAAWVEVYLYVLDWGVRNIHELAAIKPADWRRVKVATPRAPNVDVGRNSNALLAELAVGATNYDLIYGPLGLNAKRELEKHAVYAAFIRSLAEKYGVTPGEISQNAAKALAELEDHQMRENLNDDEKEKNFATA